MLYSLFPLFPGFITSKPSKLTVSSLPVRMAKDLVPRLTYKMLMNDKFSAVGFIGTLSQLAVKTKYWKGQ